VLTDAVHCSSFDLDPSFMILVDSPNPRRIHPTSYNKACDLFFVSWLGHILAWRLILCATLFLLCLCECVFRKIFVFVLHLLLSCAQNGSESYCCVCSLGASSWRVGRETGCAFLYGVIAIGRSLSRDAFENWWATACWVLYTSKLSSSLLLWCSHYCWSSPTLTCPFSLTTQAQVGH
jgi:hypothetical protein